MAAFSASTYPTTSYERHRPTYPSTLYTSTLLPYHHGARTLLLDLGCGPGTVTRPLSAHFSRTLGVDPSASFLAAARAASPPTVSYHRGTSEHLPFVASASVDMAVAAQAAHWFDQARWWHEMARVVRRGGTVAAWGYKDALLPRMPRASRVLRRYSRGVLAGYWGQPARAVVEGGLRAVRPPEGWGDVLRWESEPGFEVAVDPETVRELCKGVERRVLEGEGEREMGRWVRGNEGLLRCEWSLAEVEGYVRTWSAVHLWREANPGRVSRREGGDGDVVDEMMAEMVAAEGLGEDWEEVRTVVAWGHGLVMARRE